MVKIFTTCLIVLANALAPIAAQAGNDKGNGGNVVVCGEAGKPTTARLLDYYEAKVLRDIDYEMGDSGLPAIAKVHYVLKRLARLDPIRAQQYNQKADEFYDNARFVAGVVLPSTNDYGYVPVPADCRVEQLAIQKKPTFPEDKLYLISRDLWSLLDEDHRAGLILHEIIYGEAIAKGQTNSINSRYFNGLISSAKPNTMAQDYYVKIIEKVGLATAGTQALTWTESPIQLHYACADYSYQFSLHPFVNYSAGMNPTFSAGGDLPAWLTLDHGGRLTGTPDKTQLGRYNFMVAVHSGESGAANRALIEVQDCDHGNEFKFEAIASLGFAADLKPLAKLPSAQFRLVSGPAWAQVSTQGVLFGRPGIADVGTNTFRILASVSHESRYINLVIEVKKPKEPRELAGLFRN